MGCFAILFLIVIGTKSQPVPGTQALKDSLRQALWSEKGEGLSILLVELASQEALTVG